MKRRTPQNVSVERLENRLLFASPDTTPPTAALDAQQPTALMGATNFVVTVDYSDDVAVDTTTLGNNNILVTGPNNFSEVGQYLGPVGADATSVQANYQLKPVDASLNAVDNGSYTVSMLPFSNGANDAGAPTPSGVSDTSGNGVPAGPIGNFNLVVQPAPVLQLSSPTYAAGVYNPGGAIAFGATVSNQGAATASSFSITVRLLSSSQRADTQPTIESTTIISQSLAPGQSVALSLPPLSIPATASSANYFLAAQINFNVAGAVHNSSDSFQSTEPDIVILDQAPTPPPAAPGGLVSSFGTGGIVQSFTGLGTTNAVVQQPDGKTITVGELDNADGFSDFGVSRFNTDGSNDTTFGQTISGGVTTPGTGTVSTNFGGDDLPIGVAVQPDGKIVVAGYSTSETNPNASTFALARFNSDGSVDTAFGTAGHVLTSFVSDGSATTSSDVATQMLLLANGQILVVGRSNAGGRGEDFAIARYNPDGSLDTAFNGTGKLLTDFQGGDDSANAVAIDPRNSDIVVAGSSTSPSTTVTEFAVARYTTSGALDSRFGNAGKLLTPLGAGGDDEAFGVAVDAKGDVAVTGASFASGTGATPFSQLATVLYTPAGGLTRKFGTGGIVVTNVGQPAVANQVQFESDGSLLVSGATTASLQSVDTSHIQVVIVKYAATGTLDTRFATGGKLLLDLSGGASPAIGRPRPSDVPGPTFEGRATQAQQALDALARQRAIYAALGVLVIVAQNGSQTAVAQVVASGASLSDLIQTLLPANIIDGSKGAARVLVANSGNIAANGTATIALYASHDTTFDGTDVLLQSVPNEKLKLRPNVSKAYKFKFVVPASVPRGVYYILAVVRAGATITNINAANDVAHSATTVQIAPPMVALSGPALSPPASLQPGVPAIVNVTVTNGGNVTAKGTVGVKAFAAAGITPSDSDAILAALTWKLKLAPGASRVFPIKLLAPATLAQGSYNLLVVLTPNLSAASTNPAGEVIAGASPVKVSLK